jgi:hypothetical protein
MPASENLRCRYSIGARRVFLYLLAKYCRTIVEVSQSIECADPDMLPSFRRSPRERHMRMYIVYTQIQSMIHRM